MKVRNLATPALLLVFIAAHLTNASNAATFQVAGRMMKECFTFSETKNSNTTVSCSSEKSDDCCIKRCKQSDGKCSCGRDSEFCRSEADCCSFAKSCVDSKCVCNGAGRSCAVDKECCSGKCTGKKPNKVCGCSAIGVYCGDGERGCCNGAYCRAKLPRRCVKLVEIGGSCGDDVECGSRTCSGGKCVCASKKSPCFKKTDCCGLPGKPAEAVGCVQGLCNACIPSTITPIRDMGDFCDKKGSSSEACCIGSCKQKNQCQFPVPPGGYCVSTSECTAEDECTNNKCVSSCTPKGGKCNADGSNCCSLVCRETGGTFETKERRCE